MKNIIKYSEVALNINKDLKIITLQGNLGKILRTYNGTGIFFLSNKLFIYTKKDFKTFLSMFNTFYKGVTFGFFIEINFIGLGSRFLRIKNGILLKLGLGHYIKYLLPKSIIAIGYKRNLIFYGIDLQEINELAKKIRLFKKPNIYKGKGIQINGEVINFKIGKQK